MKKIKRGTKKVLRGAKKAVKDTAETTGLYLFVILVF